MAEQKAERPIPKAGVYVDTAPFWEAVEKKELHLQYCEDTGQFQHYPRPVSIYTGSRNLSWRKVSGNGTIYAVTMVRIPGPGMEGRLPLPVVTVDLEEGVRIVGNVLDTDAEKIVIGARVELAWDELSADKHYPAFKVV